jgi:CelD/BcsL family acetyltransferase involved in cellulose biosynthesis
MPEATTLQKGMSSAMIDYIESLEGMRPLERRWTDLERLFGSPLLSWEWFFAGAAAFCPPDELKIAVRKHDGVLDGIAPLGVRRDWIRRLEILGTTILTEEGGFLYENTAALSELIDSVIRLKMPIFLRRLRIHSEETKVWEREIRAKRVRCLVREERLPWIAIRSKWEEFEKQISSSRRSSFRRLQRLAESKGNVTFDVVVPTSDNLDKYLNEAFEVEAASWKGKKGTAMKVDPKLGPFFREYARQTTELGEFRLFFLRVDERAIAVELNTIHANRMWILKIGHDESWSWCSPGILLMHKIIKYCFETGLEGCEFGGTDEPWLHIWANESRSAWTYRIYPRSSKGLIQLILDFLQMVVKKIKTVLSTEKAKMGQPNHAQKY